MAEAGQITQRVEAVSRSHSPAIRTDRWVVAVAALNPLLAHQLVPCFPESLQCRSRIIIDTSRKRVYAVDKSEPTCRFTPQVPVITCWGTGGKLTEECSQFQYLKGESLHFHG